VTILKIDEIELAPTNYDVGWYKISMGHSRHAVVLDDVLI
jgi:hypothetical protein